MTSGKNKLFAILKVDSMIDIITNSSSELFVMEATQTKEVVVEILNKALEGHSNFRLDDIQSRLFKEEDAWENENKVQQILEHFPEDERETLRLQYFTDTRWYAVSFDRDWIFEKREYQGMDIRKVLGNIGFELIDTDY